MGETGHTHNHSRPGTPAGKRRLSIALVLTVIYMFAEAIGGWISNSLALMADAGHMLTDAAAMALVLAAYWLAARPATARKTYGFYRAEILTALLNGVALVLISIWVIYEAVVRWQAPPSVRGGQMTLIAVGGLIVNIVVAAMLHGAHDHDLNMRGAWLHVIGDLLGSAAAIAAGVLITFAGWLWADPLSSVIIGGVIIAGAWRIVSESVNILLEGTPRHIDLAAVESAIAEAAGVTGIHDLHVWTISSGIEALSAHINHDESVHHSELLAAIRDRLHSGFGIDHLTIQMETTALEAEAVYVCETGTRCFEPVREGRQNAHDRA